MKPVPDAEKTVDSWHKGWGIKSDKDTGPEDEIRLEVNISFSSTYQFTVSDFRKFIKFRINWNNFLQKRKSSSKNIFAKESSSRGQIFSSKD